MSESNVSQLYCGSLLLKPLSQYLEIPLDQINFVVSQLFALIFGIFFRTVLSHRKVSINFRHYSSLLVGVLIAYFFIGQQIYHLLILTTLSYISILICSPTIVQKVVLFVGLTHLSYLNLMRLFSGDLEFTMDITAPLMVAVQRVTNVGFSLNDGLTKTEEDLTEEQKRYAIRKKPTILEFFSYLFQFPTLICGPLVFYNDYIQFINGHNFEKHFQRKSELPSPSRTVIRKVSWAILFAILHCLVVPKFPLKVLKDNHFLYETSFLSKLCFIVCHTSVARFKYYHGFILGESICNASGLGFDGFTSDGRPIWDLMSNVDVFYFENALNLRIAFESWNKTTQTWFRRSAYERNRRYKLVWTYLLSSVWHGLYPGYYMMSFSFAFFTLAARNVRRCVRHRFRERGTVMTLIYDCLTYISTRLVFAYMVLPFCLLEFWPSIELYKQLYFFGHILGLVAIFILPKIIPPKPKTMSKVKDHHD